MNKRYSFFSVGFDGLVTHLANIFPNACTCTLLHDLPCLVVDILGDAAVLESRVKGEGEPAGVRQGRCHRQQKQQRPRIEHLRDFNLIHLSQSEVSDGPEGILFPLWAVL